MNMNGSPTIWRVTNPIAEILSQDEAGEILSSYAAQNLRDVLLRYIQVPYSSSPISTQCILYLSDQFQLSSQLSSAALGEVSTWTVASSLRQRKAASWMMIGSYNVNSRQARFISLPCQNSRDNLYFGRIIRNTYLSSPEHSIQMGTLVFSVSLGGNWEICLRTLPCLTAPKFIWH